MQLFIGIIAFIFMLSVIVLIHEWGHFMVARHFGVFCHEFSIGMGPALYQKQGKETIFSIRAIPFGGYVMMAGEEDGSQDEQEDDWLKEVPDDRRLNHKSHFQQICILLAGIFMNLVLAWVIFVGVAMARGYVVEPAKPIVYKVVENSPAQKAGLQKSDRIVKAVCKDETIKPQTQYDLLEWIQYNHDTITLTVKRNQSTLTMQVKPSYDKKNSMYTIGYQAMAYAKHIHWYQGFGVGTDDFISSSTAIFQSLNMLVHGQGYENLSGPIGIFNVTSKTTQMGWLAYLSLFAMISLNIGIFNLLPIPALDGGRVLIALIEVIFRRKIKREIVEKVILVSFALLIALFVFATYNDILRFI